ncbi:MAG: mechanosensitive ion channel [Acidiferrobacterales bacterium]|nr:mechanosensitive ion channel [Acidiferrobacterales bacterium]
MSLSMISLLLPVLTLAFFSLLVLRIRRRSGVRLPLGFCSIALTSAIYFSLEDLLPRLDLADNFNQADAHKLSLALICLAIAYTVNVSIKRFVYGRRLTDDGDSYVPLIVQYVSTVLVYLVALMFIIRVIYGLPIFALAATSGALAIVLGYSARAVLEEVFAGIALNLSSPFEKNDLVQLNGEWAQIKDIGWRSITYLDMDSNYVVVPNSVVAASKIRNLDRPDSVTRRLQYFYVDYNTPPLEVIKLAESAMLECPAIIADHPWNEVSVYDTSEKGIKYRAAFHINGYLEWFIASNQYTNALWYRFKRNDIRFGEQRKLNFEDPESAKRNPTSSAFNELNWRALVERFGQTPMFDGMDDEDMNELARSAQLHVVGVPERIIKEGSSRTSMYLIASGEADVFGVDHNGRETWMASVGEGETLGLMSLLTGTSQRTTVRARTEIAVWEISSESLHAIFERKPDVMNNIAEAIAKWQVEEDEALNALEMSRKQEAKLLEKQTSSLSKRIARFFNTDQSVKERETAENEGHTNY